MAAVARLMARVLPRWPAGLSDGCLGRGNFVASVNPEWRDLGEEFAATPSLLIAAPIEFSRAISMDRKDAAIDHDQRRKGVLRVTLCR